MKKLFLVLSMICLSLTVFAQADKGRSSFGFNLGYAFDTEQATLGLDYRYCLTEQHVRILSTGRSQHVVLGFGILA